MEKNKWNGYGWIKEANKRVWAPFDREDPLEWILIGFGIGALVVLVAMFLLYMYFNDNDNNRYG